MKEGDFSGGPVARATAFTAGAQVQSLIKELKIPEAARHGPQILKHNN